MAHRSEYSTPVTWRTRSTSQYGGVSKIHQDQGKVSAFVKEVRQLMQVSFFGGENIKNTVEERLLVKGSV